LSRWEADGEPWIMPATIEDPKVLDEIGEAWGAGVTRASSFFKRCLYFDGLRRQARQ